jgi:hypothetical protein
MNATSTPNSPSRHIKQESLHIEHMDRPSTPIRLATDQHDPDSPCMIALPTVPSRTTINVKPSMTTSIPPRTTWMSRWSLILLRCHLTITTFTTATSQPPLPPLHLIPTSSTGPNRTSSSILATTFTTTIKRSKMPLEEAMELQHPRERRWTLTNP